MADQKTLFSRTARKAKEMKGQAAVILAHLDANPSKQFTIESLTSEVKGNIVTRQDPERVVAYYLSIFKKTGVVKAERPEPVIEDEPETVEGETDDEAEEIGAE